MTKTKLVRRILTCSAIAMSVSSFFAFSPQKFDLKASIERGKEVYSTQCITCHSEQGEGIESVYPPVAKSDYLMADKKGQLTKCCMA